jgi:hypothetical protein
VTAIAPIPKDQERQQTRIGIVSLLGLLTLELNPTLGMFLACSLVQIRSHEKVAAWLAVILAIAAGVEENGLDRAV